MQQNFMNGLTAEELAAEIPQIRYAGNPGYEELYDFAWKLAYDHVADCPGAPQTPYMDEAFAPDRIWIWDTCFMSLYCKYASEVFPGVESLSNFYAPMLDKVNTPLKIHIPDNPPLFAWGEYENYRLTGDRKRLEQIFFEKKYPQRMFELFENFRGGEMFDYMTSICPVQWKKKPVGYYWTGGRCGMDNTPRGDFGIEVFDNDPAYHEILFVDAIALQALSAKIIWEVTGEETYQQKHAELCGIINEYYWDEEDGLYYDIEAEAPHRRVKVKTPASFWPLLAGACSPVQAAALAKNAADPMVFGGDYPFPSVSRDSVHYEPRGRYWRGGVWLPTAYMAIKALEANGHVKLADELAAKVVDQQYRTWKDFSPHTIWEAYSPSEVKPSNGKFDPDEWVRPDFCGWSALGPICLMIENVLGIQADGIKKIVNWRIRHSFAHGINNLKLGGVKVDLHYDGHGTVEVKTDSAFTLILNDKSHRIDGNQKIAFKC